MRFCTVTVGTPITASDTDLAAAVVDEIERTVLWRSVVFQTRKIVLDGSLPPLLELEPVTGVVSLTMWSPTDDAAVIGAANYNVSTRDPGGGRHCPGSRYILARPRAINRELRAYVYSGVGSHA